ncbi:MAG: hypothetical protein PF541_18105 [Prolixibacteraceae bacterium]|jgi:hypothetical protein|nr:hypothetical protein [Prolixibacteraceae bacterium]
MFRKLVSLAFFISFFTFAFAQRAYRINADILTKTRLVDSTFQVSKGKLYYDINNKKIIFDFRFPRKEKFVLFDTIMSVFENNKLKSTSFNYLIPEQSFFHYMLSGEMSNFGLNESSFMATNIEKKKDLIVTTWEPPDNLKPILSKILVATKDKQLYSLTMVNGEGKIINRQIIKNYQFFDDIEIPTEVLVATYLTNGTMYQIITLSNVVLNEEGNDEQYNYDL